MAEEHDRWNMFANLVVHSIATTNNGRIGMSPAPPGRCENNERMTRFTPMFWSFVIWRRFGVQLAKAMQTVSSFLAHPPEPQRT